MQLSEALKQLKAELNLTQEELASALHLSCDVLDSWNTEDNIPDAAAAKDLMNLACNPKVSAECVKNLYQSLWTSFIKPDSTEQVLKMAAQYTYSGLNLLNLSTGIITVVFENGDFPVFAQRAYRKTYDYDEFMGRYTQNLDPQDARLKDNTLEYIRNRLQKEDSYSTSSKIRFLDKTWHTMKTTYYLYDRAASLCLLIHTDVTSVIALEEAQQKKLEEALEQLQRENAEKSDLLMQRERLYTALFSLVPMVISSNLTDNTYYMINYDNFTTKEAAYSGSFDELIRVGAATIPIEDRQAFIDAFSRQRLLEAYEEGKKSVSLEHRQVGDDGIIRWILTQVIFVQNSMDSSLCTITLSMDISERKQNELRLNEALKDANLADQAKSDFLARMSHDLRTPMNAILGLTALTLDDAENPQAVRDNMTKMRVSSDFMLGLINDILDMAKIDNGTLELKPEPYSYHEFILGMQTMFAPLCQAKGINLSMHILDINPVVLADKVRLNQIFTKILSNALKFTPTGGKIDCIEKNLEIQNGILSSDFIIQDTGIGMSKEFQKHLYEKFSQENGNADLQGSGLGLPIARQLTEKMGGTIQIESEKGKGSTVTVHLSLPLVCADQKKVTAPENSDPDEILNGKTVLLAEDHPLNAMIAQRLLEKKHMTVICAENGRTAADAFRESKPGTYDLILMDIRMPVMDGYEATQIIRSLDREDSLTIPIIAMTANAYAEDVQKCMDAGMNAHLSKPIDPQLLYETIAQYIK